MKIGKSGGIPIGAIMVFAIGIIAIIYILKNKHLLTGGAKPGLVTAAAIDPSPTCPTGGETCAEDDQGRYDCLNVTQDSYEATWCGSFSGDDLTIKLYGPEHHSSGDCCWCVLHIKPDSGQFVGGGEGPHPGSNCEDKGEGESIGTTSDICVKAVIQPGPHVTGYALMNGAWQQMIDYTGDCGCDQTASEKTGDEVTFRCDGDFNTTCATVIPYAAGGETPAPAPTTTPPTTTPPADGEEEEEPEDGGEDEEEDSGDGDGEDEDYGENAEEYDEDSPEGRATSERVNRLTGAAGARSRRGNLARPFTRAALSAYSSPYINRRGKLRLAGLRK